MDLVTLDNNNQILTSSRVVVDKFNKRHDGVLRDIENIMLNIGETLINGETTELWTPIYNKYFIESKYTTENSNGVMYKEYLINRDGFMLLVMGFTGKEALKHKIKYIN